MLILLSLKFYLTPLRIVLKWLFFVSVCNSSVGMHVGVFDIVTCKIFIFSNLHVFGVVLQSQINLKTELKKKCHYIIDIEFSSDWKHNCNVFFQKSDEFKNYSNNWTVTYIFDIFDFNSAFVSSAKLVKFKIICMDDLKIIIKCIFIGRRWQVQKVGPLRF